MTRRSEFALIAAFRERLPGPHGGVLVGSGDDAAVVRAGGAHTVVSVDTTVDGIHARLDLGDPEQAARDFGWRALTTALSDLGACGVGLPGIERPADGEGGESRLGRPMEPGSGGRAAAGGDGASEDDDGDPDDDLDDEDDGPSFVWAIPADTPRAPGIEVYVAVTLPTAMDDDQILAIADGMAEASRTFGVSVVGGDVTTGPAVVISTTVVGWLDDPPLTRSGARPGDLVGLTGPIGAAGAGLALTLGEVDDSVFSAARSLSSYGGPAAALRSAYLRPVPQLSTGAALRAMGATPGIDLSDGLAADAGHVAESSHVRLVLDPTTVPLAPGVAAVAAALGRDPLVFAQSAGEDFVLLTTVPPARRAAAEAAGVVAWIGRVEHAVGPDGRGDVVGLPEDPTGRQGHDHRG